MGVNLHIQKTQRSLINIVLIGKFCNWAKIEIIIRWLCRSIISLNKSQTELLYHDIMTKINNNPIEISFRLSMLHSNYTPQFYIRSNLLFVWWVYDEIQIIYELWFDKLCQQFIYSSIENNQDFPQNIDGCLRSSPELSLQMDERSKYDIETKDAFNVRAPQKM